MSQNAPAWIATYRGKPFARGAEGPDAYDCYGLVRAVLRDRFGVEVPALEDAHLLGVHERAQVALTAPDCPWRTAWDLREGDVLSFVVGDELHVGIVLDGELMLHARVEHGVQVGHYRRPPWALHRVGPGYRHRALEGAAT